MKKKINKAAQAMGKLRMAKLTPEERSELARKAGSTPKKKRTIKK